MIGRARSRGNPGGGCKEARVVSWPLCPPEAQSIEISEACHLSKHGAPCWMPRHQLAGIAEAIPRRSSTPVPQRGRPRVPRFLMERSGQAG